MSTSKMTQHTVRAAAHSSRSMHSSSAARAAAADVRFAPPILDIFDVPVRLRHSGAPAPRPEQAKPPQGASSFALSGRALNPWPTPTSLPNPLVFEGPAGRRPVMRQHHELPQHRASSFAPRRGQSQGSEPAITMFDGPAHSGGRSMAYAQTGAEMVSVQRFGFVRPVWDSINSM